MSVDSSRILFYTGGFTHPFHRHQFECSPLGVNMVPGSVELTQYAMKADIAGQNSRFYRAQSLLKESVIDVLACARVPNVRRVRRRDVSLIHSSQHLILSPRVPWVVDFEDTSVFFWYRKRLMFSDTAMQRATSLLADDRCRAVLPWSEAARRSLTELLRDPRIDRKTRVVYPALGWLPDRRSENRSSPKRRHRLLFVGGDFYAKGGLETLRAYKRLRAHFDVELLMVTHLPREAASEALAAEGVTIESRLSQKDLNERFGAADLFVLPCHTDTWGLAFLEAFSYSCPAIGPDFFSIPEIIDPGRTGSLIESENSNFDNGGLPRFDLAGRGRRKLVKRWQEPSDSYVQRLTDSIADLLDDPERINVMGQEARKEVESGRYSCNRRRSAMAAVYEDALA